MSRLARLAALAGILCLLTALVAWLLAAPEIPLVGARQPAPRAADYRQLQRPDFADAKAVLETTAIWGVLRSGQPIPPTKATANEEEKPVQWQVVGLALRKADHYLLVQIEGQNPAPVREGEKLPDGATLRRVFAKGYVVVRPDGEQETILTNL